MNYEKLGGGFWRGVGLSSQAFNKPNLASKGFGMRWWWPIIKHQEVDCLQRLVQHSMSTWRAISDEP